MLRERQLPSIDPCSFTQDLPWVNHEWLAELRWASRTRSPVCRDCGFHERCCSGSPALCSHGNCDGFACTPHPRCCCHDVGRSAHRRESAPSGLVLRRPLACCRAADGTHAVTTAALASGGVLAMGQPARRLDRRRAASLPSGLWCVSANIDGDDGLSRSACCAWQRRSSTPMDQECGCSSRERCESVVTPGNGEPLTAAPLRDWWPWVVTLVTPLVLVSTRQRIEIHRLVTIVVLAFLSFRVVRLVPMFALVTAIYIAPALRRATGRIAWLDWRPMAPSRMAAALFLDRCRPSCGRPFQ